MCSSDLQPYIVALMVEAARVRPGNRVLEVGAGSGYATAVLSRIATQVHAIEWHASLARLASDRLAVLGYGNATVVRGDGSVGDPAHAPFDAIIVSPGGPEVPEPLLEQLKMGGRLVIPVGHDPLEQELLRTGRVGPCSRCGGIVKSATISFGQAMPERAMRRAEEETSACDLFIVMGSSLVVYPAASFPEYAKIGRAHV